MKTRLGDFIFGHPRALQFLSSALESDRMPQSILITGPDQVGKETLATQFAASINCVGGKKPCQACASCKKIATGNHPDIFYIHEPNDSTLKIEQIRDIQQYLVLRPLESQYKIAVLSNFERATSAAANALLKTLEEPPAHVILLLTAKNKSQLLPTIVSRCQIIPLKPISESIIATVLAERHNANEAQASLLSKLAMGRIGWAINALSHTEILARREQFLTDLLEILEKGSDFRLAYAQQFTRTQQPIIEVLGIWLSLWRDILYYQVGNTDHIVNLDMADQLRWFADTLTTDRILSVLENLQQTLHNFNYNVNVRLNFEVLLLNLPRLERRLV
ncbi:MAG: DNA polymerase III subunit delta' [Chloroflexota bacterium]